VAPLKVDSSKCVGVHNEGVVGSAVIVATVVWHAVDEAACPVCREGTADWRSLPRDGGETV
jgi:hypothetical protein